MLSLGLDDHERGDEGGIRGRLDEGGGGDGLLVGGVVPEVEEEPQERLADGRQRRPLFDAGIKLLRGREDGVVRIPAVPGAGEVEPERGGQAVHRSVSAATWRRIRFPKYETPMGMVVRVCP